MAIVQDSQHPDGVYDDNGHNGGSQVVRARDRKANAAIEMKIEGYTWQEIAEALGYPTARHALVATEKALEKRVDENLDKKQLRQMADQRLGKLFRSISSKVNDPDHPEHLAAVAKSRDLLNDWVKLHGAAAPAEVTIYNPSEAEIDTLVSQFTATQVPQVEEDDIFSDEPVDGELVED